MSETVNYLWIAKNRTREQIDWLLSTLVEAGIDCYAEGSMVFVHPDQWDKAVDSLLAGERRSAQVNV